MRLAAILCFFLALGVGGVWIAHGRHMATLTEKPVEETTTDEFGDPVKSIRWEKTFELGLDFAGPGAGGLVGLGALLLFLGRRKRPNAIR